MVLVIVGLLVGALATPASAQAQAAAGTHYYVDSVNGSDSNAGTAPDKAWKSLAPVHSRNFLPGDFVHFKRGSTWTGALTIDTSGTSTAPITFTTYGEGARPVFSNPSPDGRNTNSITLYASWVVVEGLLARDAKFAGVYLWEGSDHNIIRDVEATNVGQGIVVIGQYNLITGNYIHDTTMVKSTAGGDDDFGALAIMVNASHNEVSYNRMVNCIAPSFDYGVDGGAVEISANNATIEDVNIHHNRSENVEGFLEIGGPAGLAKDVTVAYNVMVNSGRLIGVSLTGNWYVTLANVRIENNTFHQTGPRAGGGTEKVFCSTAALTPAMMTARNNIFYAVGSSYGMTTHNGFGHSNNLYRLDDGAPEYALAAGEKVAEPGFVGGGDLRLQGSSPAVDGGMALGYAVDLEGNAVPGGAAPDLGAFEYVGPAATPVPPTATPVPPTATPTRTSTSTPIPATPTATHTSTSTPVPPAATPTSTFTPAPQATPTATHTSTSTPVPPAATPTSTFTPAPQATPTRTSTSTPIPATATRTPTMLPTATPTSAQARSVIARVNVGGGRYVDQSGVVWKADKQFATGSWGYTSGSQRASASAISKTKDDPLYQSERYWLTSALPGYRFPVTEAGQYQVTFKLAELAWSASNKRLFNIKLEGVRVVKWLDIYAAAGKNVALDLSYTTVVTDGELNIDFVRLNGFDLPKVEAIQVEYVGPVTASSMMSPAQEAIHNALFIKAAGPDRGVSTGGFEINLVGDSFQPGAQVLIGNAACADVRVITSEELSCRAPAGAAGVADVTVTNPDGQRATLSGGLTYYRLAGATQVFMPAMSQGATTEALDGE